WRRNNWLNCTGPRGHCEQSRSPAMEFESEHDQRRTVECVHSGPYEIRRGDRVRLCPRRRADVMDIVLEGKVARVEAIEIDLDDWCYLAVVIADDPGADLGFARQIGHRFFFALDEVEPVDLDAADDEDSQKEAAPGRKTGRGTLP